MAAGFCQDGPAREGTFKQYLPLQAASTENIRKYSDGISDM